MGLQLGYLLGGSILIETVFSWPGTGFLLNPAIFQRDLPLLQGTILVLAVFFVLLNLRRRRRCRPLFDPRIERSLNHSCLRHPCPSPGPRAVGAPSSCALAQATGASVLAPRLRAQPGAP